jgi:hypothetical protein
MEYRPGMPNTTPKFLSDRLFMQVFPSQMRRISKEIISKFRHNFLETQPFWETGSILESLHHA